MKKKILALLCTLLLGICASNAYAANRLLPNLEKNDNLTSVYVGKALLRMVANGLGDTTMETSAENGQSDNNMGLKLAAGKFNVGDFIRYLNSVEVVTADSKKTVAYLQPLAEKAIKAIPDLELAMEEEEGNEYTQIYIVTSADGNSYSRMIVVCSEPGEYNVIDMQGQIPIDILSQINM
ncbi:MAG: DUF4252 domain-containing protein [Muribaculaceae bacterium]|nr:DUF4252 domain-containing protein [Muribaculaceae bacterium]